ncbi:MAG: fdrA domain protein [Nitrososphaeria archaeon]
MKQQKKSKSETEASKLFGSPLKVINIGLDVFYQALKDQGVEAVQVSWKPPIKLEKEYEDILSKIL